MFSAVKRIISCDLGTTAREFGLIAVLITTCFVVALANLGASIRLMHETGATSIADSSR
jgi:Flp pilus assembly pilin Flp